MKPLMGRTILVSFSVVLLLFSIAAAAQTTTSIRGTVADPTAAMVPGVNITLEHTGTGAVRTTVTDERGGYQVLQIPPGSYRIRAELAGFKTVSRDIQLLVNTPMTLNLRFDEVGQVTEVVDVTTADVATVNTVDATIGNTIQNNQIVALPLEGRNVVGLLSLQPGVVYTGLEGRGDTRGGTVAGARSDQTNVTLDGVDVNDQQSGTAFESVLPVTLDSVQEFRVVTANATANQGRSSGGQVSLVTKSGTNEFHGSLYEYHRNTITTANDFFNNATVNPVTGRTLERPKLIRNIFGGSLGGPIKQNRMFFFFNFEDTITRRDEPVLRTVPTDTLRQGILLYRDRAGAVQQITPDRLRQMDPLRIGPNPAILQLLQQYPRANDPSQGDDSGLNFAGYRFNAPLKSDKPSLIAKLDYMSADSRHLLFLRGAMADWTEDEEPPQFPGQPPSLVRLTTSKGVAAGHTWTISPRLINDFRWGLTRQAIEFGGGSTKPGFRFRGLSTLENFDARSSARKIPVSNFTEDLTWIKGSHTLQLGANLRVVRNQRYTEARTYPFYHVNNGWAPNLGRNLLPSDIASASRNAYVRAQMGLLGTISQLDITYFYNTDGSVFPVPHIPRREFANNEYEFYLQDQWKLTQNLTLTAGLRYSYFEPPYEKNGFMVRADFDVNQWFATRRDQAAAGIPSNRQPLLRFVLSGKENNGLPLFNPDKNNFAPRFALAWTPSFSDGILNKVFGDAGQTSIRFGGSLFYDRTGGSFPITTDLNGAVGLATFRRNPTASFDYDTAPRFNGMDRLTSITLPTAPPGGFPSVLASGSDNQGFMVDTSLRTPYSTTFNFSISRDLPGGVTFETAYVGRLGRQLMIQTDFAAPLVNFRDARSGQTWIEAIGLIGSLIDAEAATSSVPMIPFIENVFPSLAGNGRTASQNFYREALGWAPSWMDLLYDLDVSAPAAAAGAQTFYQQQFNWLPAWTNMGRSSYHSLQVIARKRMSGGLLADFNYTFARSIDNGSSVESEGQGAGQILNAFEPRKSFANSNFDIRHQLNSNFVLDLPFGRERRWASNLHPVIDGMFGGWQVSGLLRYRTGFPLSVGNGFNFPTNYFLTGPATLTGTKPVVEIDKSATGGPNMFGSKASDAYKQFSYTKSGDSGSRNVLYGPGFFTIDSGVHKVFRIDESRRIVFRWETFNLTNTVSFDGRAGTGVEVDLDNSSTFGRFRRTAGSPRIMQFALRFEF